MTDLSMVPNYLKLFRGKLDDELWKKLMRLFVHGEECMAVEILCEELLNGDVKLNSNEKHTLQKAIQVVELDIGDYQDVLK